MVSIRDCYYKKVKQTILTCSNDEQDYALKLVQMLKTFPVSQEGSDTETIN